jgi:ribosomal protein S18 acetylase RimI-like enzyme
MTDPEFDEYRERMVVEYAKAGGKATGMDPGDALAFATKQIADLLPEGLETPGQHFKSLEDPSGAVVGILWFATRLETPPARVFIYDINIAEDHRGRGLGSAAMDALEEEARRLGAARVGLHVFADNVGAIRLYERLGYESKRSTDGGM